MKMTKEFQDFLYQYWRKNADDLCGYCKHCKPCGEKVCPKYNTYVPESVSLDGKPITREEYPQAYEGWSCMDTEFGDCDMLRDTPCYKCIENNMEHFEWNGVVPTDMSHY